MKKNVHRLKIGTPLGELTVCINKEPEYPALWISLEIAGQEIPLATVEVAEATGPHPKLQSIIFADMLSDEPTSIIEHTGLKERLYGQE